MVVIESKTAIDEGLIYLQKYNAHSIKCLKEYQHTVKYLNFDLYFFEI